MTIHRFTGSNTQKAMAKVHEVLGDEAMIYSTRSFAGGVEILAALPDSAESKALDVSFAFEDFSQTVTAEVFPPITEDFHVSAPRIEDSLIQKLNSQLEMMDEKFNKLSHRLQGHFPEDYSLSADENNVVLYHLARLGFRGQFAREFLRNHASPHLIGDVLHEEGLQNALHGYIKTAKTELIDSNSVCALIGPTGIGKTTTIAKLAKRFISKHGPASLGLISTDYHDIASKNQLIYYSNLLNVDLEYANNPDELTAALRVFKNKKLVLIDTYGVSQRDQQNLAELRAFLGSQGERIATYITLPCNVQEDVLNDIARKFTTANLRGCILTKEDESISMTTAVSVCMSHALNIAYICNGQNIYKDIRPANSADIMQNIITDAGVKSRALDQLRFRNAGTISKNQDEGSYERQSGRP